MIDVKSMSFADIGESYTNIDADRSLVLHGFLSKIGETPSFDSWEAARKEWGTGYKRVKTAANDDAVNTAWSRFVGGLRNYAAENGFTCTVPDKPKSTNPEAVKKAASRANPLQGKTLDEVRKAKAEAAEAVKTAPTREAVDSLARAIEAEGKLVKAEAEARAKAAKAAIQPRIDAMMKILRAADGRTLTLFEALHDATRGDSTAEAKAAAWSVILACAPGAAKADKAAKAERKAA